MICQTIAQHLRSVRALPSRPLSLALLIWLAFAMGTTTTAQEATESDGTISSETLLDGLQQPVSVAIHGKSQTLLVAERGRGVIRGLHEEQSFDAVIGFAPDCLLAIAFDAEANLVCVHLDNDDQNSVVVSVFDLSSMMAARDEATTPKPIELDEALSSDQLAKTGDQPVQRAVLAKTNSGWYCGLHHTMGILKFRLTGDGLGDIRSLAADNESLPTCCGDRCRSRAWQQ